MLRPVNRLDKGTSGLLVLAKRAEAHERLQGLLHTDDFRREYLALAARPPRPDREPPATRRPPTTLIALAMSMIERKGLRLGE